MAGNIIVAHMRDSSLVGKVQRFDCQAVRLGRDNDNDIVFDPYADQIVSGKHAELYIQDSKLWIRDLDSTNGTWLNGEQLLEPRALRPTDSIRLGETGPELRCTIAGGREAPSTILLPRDGPQFKDARVMKAIERSVATQHKRINRRAYFIVASVIAIALISAILFIINNKDLAKAVQHAQLSMEELKSEMEKSMRIELDSYELEISGLKGKLGKDEIKIARLIVELKERGKGLDLLKMRQDLSEAQRKALVLSSKSEMEKLAEVLQATQEELRSKTGNDRWADLVSRFKNGVFLVVARKTLGKDFVLGIGTAFCIDKKGTLATNAHVAKMFDGASIKIAIQNGTGKIFTITDHRYHPDWKSPTSPDVGLLLIDTEGTELTALPLADTEDLKKLRIGTQLGTLGYPGELLGKYLGNINLKLGLVPTAMATFKDGWIGRMTDFESASADFKSAQLIQHSASLSGGTSGSPMFTSDGKVVALNNAGTEFLVHAPSGHGPAVLVKSVPSAAEIAYAIRVDVLLDFKKKVKW